MRKLKQSNAGFTIIELLIATAIFSVILVTLSGAAVQISRMFYKGITAANTQEVARTILNEVSQSAKFDAAGVVAGQPSTDPTLHAYCIGSTQYSYKLGVQQGSASSAHALVRSTQAGCSGQPPQDVTSASASGQELLSSKMRLARFDVSSVIDPITGVKDPDLFRITVRVVFGDDDLLCDAAQAATTCDTTAVMTIPNVATDLRCKNLKSGTQFCAMSELSTIVEKRIH